MLYLKGTPASYIIVRYIGVQLLNRHTVVMLNLTRILTFCFGCGGGDDGDNCVFSGGGPRRRVNVERLV